MRSLTKALPLAALLTLAAAGCPDKGGPTEPPPLPSPKAADTAPAASAAPSGAGSATADLPKKKKRPKTREAPSPEKMRQYRKHLTEGRSLASKSQWPEAIKEFDAALAVVPGDAPALTELSWAAFKAGELDRSKKAGEEALQRTTSPKLKGMAHYNLGRVAEEKKDMKEAIEHYRKSIALRPNETVEKRLAELTKKEKAPAAAPRAPEPLGCQTPAAKIEDVCACLTKAQADDPTPRTCEAVKDAKLGRPDLTLLEVSVPIMETDYILVARTEKGFMPIHVLGKTYNPGAFGIFEEFEVLSAAEKTAGKTSILWLETQNARHDSDMGIDEYEEETTKTVTICVPPQGERKEWKCPLVIPAEYAYTRDRMKLEGFTPDAVTRDLMTKGLPIKEAFTLGITLTEGKAEVKVISGKPPAAAKALIGTHTL
jgi:tetratricopeptide (TPR) repeat protein